MHHTVIDSNILAHWQVNAFANNCNVWIGDIAFSVAAPRAWNRLPTELKLLWSTDSFHRDLKTFLFDCLQAPGYGLTLWCALGLLVGGAIQVPQLQLQYSTRHMKDTLGNFWEPNRVLSKTSFPLRDFLVLEKLKTDSRTCKDLRKPWLYFLCHTSSQQLAETKNLTSMPSRFIMALSILSIAALMVFGGGRTVKPMLMTLERLASSTASSFFAPSTFCGFTHNTHFQTNTQLTAFCRILIFSNAVVDVLTKSASADTFSLNNSSALPGLLSAYMCYCVISAVVNSDTTDFKRLQLFSN